MTVGLSICLYCNAVANNSVPLANDTLEFVLPEIEVVSRQDVPLSVQQKGNFLLNTSELRNTVQTLGQADVIKYLQGLSSVVSAGDYGSGLMIDGSESSQILYRISNVPVFFPYRFGGIFSVFNDGHFPRANFRRNILPANLDSRLGAVLDFTPHKSIPVKPEIMASVGIIASSASVRIPVKNKFSIAASARISYTDLLLDPLLRTKDTDIKYRFHDLNLTLTYNPMEGQWIYANLFRSEDRLNHNDGNYSLNTFLGWSNDMASIEWYNRSWLGMTNRIYYTDFKSELELSFPQLSLGAPSSISSIGVSGETEGKQVSWNCKIEGGYEYVHYFSRPQWVEVSGINPGNSGSAKTDLRNADEAHLWGSVSFEQSESLEFETGLNFNFYRNMGYKRFMADPRLTVYYRVNNHNLSFHIGHYSQFLHQLGFSETGLASDFWMLSSNNLPVQSSWNVSADWFVTMCDGALRANLNLYAKLMENQSEFSAQLIDIMNEGYDPENYLLIGKGYNVGGNLMVSYTKGDWNVTGSAGYGVARRRYPEFGEKWLRGASDPGVSLSASVIWSPGILPKWTFSSSFRLNSGRPYTPALAMYLIAGNIISEYGNPNSARFPLYHRLDLSAVWRLSKPGKKRPGQSLNFSLINAYGHRNVEFQKTVLNASDFSVKTKEICSLYRFMPSISYTITF